jgi:hypothetical protein
MLGLERDLSFTPMNAAEIYRGLNSGKTYAKGGGVGDYKLKDVVDFYYGRADEKKVISGTITDILNDGYTISTGFTQVMVKPNEIVGYSKQAEPKKKRFGIFADGGGVGDKIVAPDGYVFSKIGSHRAEQKVKRMGVEYISLYSFGGSQGTAGASNIFISEKDYDKIKGIIGVSNSKKAIKGDNHIFSRGENKKVDSVFRSIEQKYATGGGVEGVDLNDWDMPVIRTQFEDEEYEFEKGGEITENERMKSLKNYPKLKF